MEISNCNNPVKVLRVNDLIVDDVSISEILAATYRSGHIVCSFVKLLSSCSRYVI